MIKKRDNNLICIILKAFDSAVLDAAVGHVIRISKQERVQYEGPIPLPTKRTVWTVLRGPHIDKESREQFERKIHKRLLRVNATPTFIDAIGRHSLSPGIEAKITLPAEVAGVEK